MQAGKLYHRITFLSSTSTQNSVGETIPVWTTQVCTVWASIKPLSGKQLALAQANTVTSTATHEVVMRYHPAVVGQLNYRVKFGNRVFRVNSILDTEELGYELRLTVTEVAA